MTEFYLPTSEGYVKDTFFDDEHHFNYVYQYKDHLGNVRLTYGWDPHDDKLVIMVEDNYYPYGLKHRNYNMTENEYERIFPSGVGIEEVDNGVYNYKYNGKEWQDELGLNMYDMDLRDYDPAIGRWVCIDPVTHYSQSTYNGFDGNPVVFSDPSGGSTTSTLMDLFNNAGSGISTWTRNSSGGFDYEYDGSDDGIAGAEAKIGYLNSRMSLYGSSGGPITGPGARFDSADAAAIDFGMNYNGASIVNKTECHTTIYSMCKNGMTDYFSYVLPIAGSAFYIDREQVIQSIELVNKIPGAHIEAMAHTHGNFEQISDNRFSGNYLRPKAGGDIAVAKNWEGNAYGRPIDSYMCAPNGGLYYF